MKKKLTAEEIRKRWEVAVPAAADKFGCHIRGEKCRDPLCRSCYPVQEDENKHDR